MPGWPCRRAAPGRSGCPTRGAARPPSPGPGSWPCCCPDCPWSCRGLGCPGATGTSSGRGCPGRRPAWTPCCSAPSPRSEAWRWSVGARGVEFFCNLCMRPLQGKQKAHQQKRTPPPPPAWKSVTACPVRPGTHPASLCPTSGLRKRRDPRRCARTADVHRSHSEKLQVGQPRRNWHAGQGSAGRRPSCNAGGHAGRTKLHRLFVKKTQVPKTVSHGHHGATMWVTVSSSAYPTNGCHEHVSFA